MQCRAGDDAGGGDIFARQFKLRLDQDEEVGAGFGGGQRSGQDFADGNERHVERDKIDGLRNVASAQVAGIAGDTEDSGIFAQLPGQLVEVDVHRVDAGGAPLEQAVGESAGGGGSAAANAGA